jgi:hypothetical protein
MTANKQVGAMYLRQLSDVCNIMVVLQSRIVWICMSPPLPKHKTSVYHESRMKCASWTVQLVETVMLKCNTEMTGSLCYLRIGQSRTCWEDMVGIHIICLL